MLLMVFTIHFFIMGAFVLLISGLISFIFPRLYFIITVLLSMIAGLIFSYVFEVKELAMFAIILNGLLSLLAIGLVRAGIYAKQKADNYSD
ncbi:hypothetical protein [Pseudoneobacillus sp. C159]